MSGFRNVAKSVRQVMIETNSEKRLHRIKPGIWYDQDLSKWSTSNPESLGLPGRYTRSHKVGG